MALLASAMRYGAFTHSKAPIDAWLAGRQTGWWYTQNRPRVRKDPAQTVQALTQLRERGVIDQEEFDALRARLRV